MDALGVGPTRGGLVRLVAQPHCRAEEH
jgi:hypothetical protein